MSKLYPYGKYRQPRLFNGGVIYLLWLIAGALVLLLFKGLGGGKRRSETEPSQETRTLPFYMSVSPSRNGRVRVDMPDWKWRDMVSRTEEEH